MTSRAMFVFDAYLVAMIVFHVSVIRSDDEVATPDRSATIQNDLGRNSEQDGHKGFHKQAENGEHLLDHLADIVDLDGEGLRHIEDHLSQEAFKTEQLSQDIEAIKNGDDTKGIFYFFELHDFDKNGKLDGLELLHALTDHHSSASGHTEIGTSEQLFEEEVVSIIDNLLQKHDLNNDGYVDFVELMNSNPDSLWNELGTNLKANGEASLDLAGPERLGGNQEGQQE